jgi:hypothetical protein
MLIAGLAIVAAALASSGDPSAAAKGTREDKDGWIILHLSGTPHEVGFEHGSLAAPQIEKAVQAFQVEVSGRGKDWAWLKSTSHRLFWNKLDKEYQDEITGIADGARSKGLTLDADDILALNSEIEIMDYELPAERARATHTQIVSHAPLACSAFVATGTETKDGKVVMGQNFWWGYLTGEHWNVILDIKPAKGHRIMLDAVPGFIESGTDWAINDQGLGLTETTISGFTGFDDKGLPEFERMRKSIQYADSLDQLSSILKLGNNGGYANTWLMVDSKTNEIGKLELGLKNVIFSSTTDGYYCGANFPEDPKLIREETPGYREDEANGRETRKMRWHSVLDKNKGQVDGDVAKTFLEDTYDSNTQKRDGQGGGALCAKGMGGGAINAKVVTGSMLSNMQFWARMGVPDGSDLLASTQPFSGPAKSVFFDLKGEPWCLVGSR